jgi:serine/threonine protein kinase/outer membrane protein assembly factor BamB
MIPTHYEQFPDRHQSDEKAVNQILVAMELDTRRVALMALGEWQKLGIDDASLGDLAAELQSPTWGTFNRLLMLLGELGARHDKIIVGRLREIITMSRTPVDTSHLAELSAMAGAECGTAPFVQSIVSLLITVRSRIEFSAPADAQWWKRARESIAAVLPYVSPLLSISVGDGEQPTPWVFKDHGQTWVYSGPAPDFSAIYVSDKGEIRQQPESSPQLVSALGALLGKQITQDCDYQRLLSTLKPAEIHGVLLGDFLVGAPVGEGGFGTVHVGRQLSTGRKVAIKLLKDGRPPEIKARFRKEAAYLARFNHPGIVSVLAYGEDRWIAPKAAAAELTGQPWYAQFVNSAPVKTYIAMEWIDGRTLEGVYQQSLSEPVRMPSPRNLAEWFMQAADALRTVHDGGLVHRDIKPSNLMVLHDGSTIKVMDFGVARATEESRSFVTEAGKVLGTVLYMSPEQLRADEADALIGPATDVYSLCATFYELFTRHRLYESGNPQVVTSMKLNRQAPLPPRRHAKHLEWAMDVILSGGLEHDLDRRYRTMDSLCQDLNRFLNDRPILYRRPRWSRRMLLAYRRNKAVANLSAAIVAIVLTMVVHWWRLPGTLSLQVDPADAQVFVAGRQVPVGTTGSLELSPGEYHIDVKRTDFDSEWRDVYIRRGRLTPASPIRLRHQHGSLSVNSAPANAWVYVRSVADAGNSIDIPYGAPLKDLKLDTGEYELRVSAPNHFDVLRRVAISKSSSTYANVPLESASVWSYSSAKVQSGMAIIPDTDGDGIPEIIQNEADAFRILSGGTGKPIDTIELGDNTRRTFHRLDDDSGPGGTLVAGEDGELIGGNKRLIVSVIQPQNHERPLVCTWQGPVANYEQPDSVSIIAAADPSHAGKSLIAAAGRSGEIFLLDASSIVHPDPLIPAALASIARLVISEQPLQQAPFIASIQDGKASAMFFAMWVGDPNRRITIEQHLVVGAIGIADGKMLWHEDIGHVDGKILRRFRTGATPQLLWWKDGILKFLEPETGKHTAELKLPPGLAIPHGTLPFFADLEGGGIRDLVLPMTTTGQRMTAIRLVDGTVRWQITDAAEYQPSGANGELMHWPDGELMIVSGRGLSAVNPKTAEVRWTVPGTVVPGGVLVGDFRNDRNKEVFVTMQDQGLLCLDHLGRVLWVDRIDRDRLPMALIPSPDNDGSNAIIIHQHAVMYGAIRGPRRLPIWSQTALAPLQATPIVADLNHDGKLEVLQLGRWPGGDNLRAFDGKSGQLLWSFHSPSAVNSAPAVIDWNHDGKLNVVIYTSCGNALLGLFVLRGSDGAVVKEFSFGENSSVFGSPVVGSLSTGVPFAVFERYDCNDIVAVDLNNGKMLWPPVVCQFDHGNTGNFGTAQLAPSEDGKSPVIIAPSTDGSLYALDSDTGKQIWRKPLSPRGARSQPIITQVAGKQAVIGVDDVGEIYIADVRTGQTIGDRDALKIPGATAPAGHPIVVVENQKRLLVAPLGDAGVACFDLESKKLLWNFCPAGGVVASPAILREKDGRISGLVIASESGEITSADVENGTPLWHFASGSGIQADPVIADLQQDGSLNLLTADNSGNLTANRLPAQSH